MFPLVARTPLQSSTTKTSSLDQLVIVTVYLKSAGLIYYRISSKVGAPTYFRSVHFIPEQSQTTGSRPLQRSTDATGVTQLQSASSICSQPQRRAKPADQRSFCVTSVINYELGLPKARSQFSDMCRAVWLPSRKECCARGVGRPTRRLRSRRAHPQDAWPGL